MSAGSIIEGAFRLVREHPAAVAIWGLPAFLVAAVPPLIGSRAPSLFADNPSLVLLDLGYFLVTVMLVTASQRAVLQAEKRGFFYLRVGMDEVRMLGLALILAAIFTTGLAVLGMILSEVMPRAAAAGDGVAALTGFAAGWIIMAASAWLLVRLSLTAPLTLLRRKIIIGESWRLTRGRFWTLFGGYFVIFLMVFLLTMLALLTTAGGLFGEIFVGQAERPEFARQFITPLTVLAWTLNGIASALGIALGGGAAATAARELVPDETWIADTFA